MMCESWVNSMAESTAWLSAPGGSRKRRLTNALLCISCFGASLAKIMPTLL